MNSTDCSRTTACLTPSPFFIARELVGVDRVDGLVFPVAVLVEVAEFLPLEHSQRGVQGVEIGNLNVRGVQFVCRVAREGYVTRKVLVFLRRAERDAARTEPVSTVRNKRHRTKSPVTHLPVVQVGLQAVPPADGELNLAPFATRTVSFRQVPTHLLFAQWDRT